MYLKSPGWVANSVNTDHMLHSVASDLGLHCLCRSVKTAGWVTNSVDSDQMLHCAASDLSLHCLLRYLKITVWVANSADPDYMPHLIWVYTVCTVQPVQILRVIMAYPDKSFIWHHCSLVSTTNIILLLALPIDMCWSLQIGNYTCHPEACCELCLKYGLLALYVQSYWSFILSSSVQCYEF